MSKSISHVKKHTEQEAVRTAATNGNHERLSFIRLLSSSGNHSDKCLKAATGIDTIEYVDCSALPINSYFGNILTCCL